MKFWWVNQGATHVLEHEGGYMWSPMVERDGGRNQAYINMKIVSPGDLIFCHFNGHLSAIGTAQSYAYPFPRPDDFPSAQNSGALDGWRVDVIYKKLESRFAPKNVFNILQSILPHKYSPLDKNGKAVQKLYLVELSNVLFLKLLEISNINRENFPTHCYVDNEQMLKRLANIDSFIIDNIHTDNSLEQTEKDAIILARRGQGTFRKNIIIFEKKCRVSGISNPSFLIASHIKPWRDSSNKQRLDGENGLLLSPNIDRLFDRNFIGISDEGSLIVSELLSQKEREQFGLVPGENLGLFTSRQKDYLRFHRARLKTQT